MRESDGLSANRTHDAAPDARQLASGIMPNKSWI